jgi:N-acetylglutamate synthase-like GNAT family acetyltransferase
VPPLNSGVRLHKMRISYVKDRPDLVAQLIPGLIEHWRYVFPDDTVEARTKRLRTHENYDVLPIAWVAHEGDTALGTAALRITDLDGREDLGPWLANVYTDPRFRGRGIASELCRVVEMKALALGIAKLYLFTHGQESLYARLGWTRDEKTLWHGHECSIMWKDVRSAIQHLVAAGP